MFKKPRPVAQRHIRRIALDLVIVPLAYFLALALRFDGHIPNAYWPIWLRWSLIATTMFIAANFAFGNYRRLWVFASVREAMRLAESTIAAAVLLLVLHVLWPTPARLPTSVHLIAPLLVLLLEATIHFRRIVLAWLNPRARRYQYARPKRTRVLIVGVNHGARQLAHSLQNDLLGRYIVVGFLDDADENQAMSVEELPVLGRIASLPEAVEEDNVDMVVIAQRFASRAALQQVLDLCYQANVQIKILPSTLQLVSGAQLDLADLSDIEPDTLLNREPATIDELHCRRVIENQVVLVSGACGSIGSELAAQIAALAPRRLILLDIDESGLHDLHIRLQTDIPHASIETFLCNVAARRKLEHLFRTYRPSVVYHAAAYKHVPMMERFPEEAILTNVLGTRTISELAARYGVQRFVFVSTDKAVNPSSVMGATKRIGERWIHAMQRVSTTHFTAVRFGNVIGSRGSVVPTFARQIERHCPVTITHSEMHRFFISIPEAVSLVIQASAYTTGGECYMLDMGEEIAIRDLAERMIRMKGLRPNVDIPLHYIGLRPGEKLHEELKYADEERQPTPHERIFCITPPPAPYTLDELGDAIDMLVDAAQRLLSPDMLRVLCMDVAFWHAERMTHHLHAWRERGEFAPLPLQSTA
nr:nucleoside-diphosphate sugar epimerase/dehydratase [Ardenticatena sp.]